MSAASRTTRVQLGPFSTSVRGGALAIGGLIVGFEKLVPTVVGAAEAIGTIVAGGGAAGGVGILGLIQAAGTAKLATAGLGDALGGNQEAYAKLNAEQQAYVTGLLEMAPMLEQLRASASSGLLPGLGQGAASAAKNFSVLDRIVADTGKSLGALAAEGGEMLGSDIWGKDTATLGRANVQIIESLGGGMLSLADALRVVLVEASPLAVWLADAAERGANLTHVWLENKRATGELSQFFRDAHRDLQLLGSATGHGARGLINLFGAEDVDGTKTLANLDRIMGRFERWSDSPAVRGGLADAITAEIPDAVGSVISALAENLPGAGLAAGEVFWDSFWAANTEGKAFIAAITGAKLAGAIRGATPLTPLFVKELAPLGVGPGGVTGGGGRRDRTPKAARILKGLGKFALPLAPGIAIAESGLLPRGRDLPTRGRGNNLREANRPSRGAQREALQRVPDPPVQHIHNHITIEVERRQLAKAYQSYINTERARGAGIHDSQQR
jgi:hypothetical protein